MRTREKVPASERPASPGQVGEIIARFAPLLNFTSREVEAITKSPEEDRRFKREAKLFLAKFKCSVSSVSPERQSLITRMEKFYLALFGKVPNFEAVTLFPELQGEGPFRSLIVPQEIVEWTDGCPIEGTFGALKKLFPCYKYTSEILDVAIPKHDRDPKDGTYVFSVRDLKEADPDLANFSANDLVARSIKGQTILERLLHEADYFLEHGEHLDVTSVTLCSGSRYADGGVPYVHWHPSSQELYVRWCDPGLRDDGLRARSAVTL